MDSAFLKDFRKKEFPQLDEKLFLDYAGSMPISQSQASRFQFLANDVLSNPHSGTQVNRSEIEVECLRSHILMAMNLTPSEYTCIFTKNTTESLHILGKCLDFSGDFFYLDDDHNSVLGLTQLLKENGKSVRCVEKVPEEFKPDSMFVFPVQSNATGKKYPLDWISKFQAKQGLVILDAAATTFPNLAKVKPDFVVLSLLKVCGAHGGCLIVKRGRETYLRDPPPAGGSLHFSCARSLKFELRSVLSQKFESGTIAFTDLLTALEGMKTRRSFGTEEQIGEHLANLSRYFMKEIDKLNHSNGQKLVQLVPQRDSTYGATFAFNLLKDNGQIINHHDIQFIFAVYRIFARFGSHCNPGAVFKSLGWSPEEVEELNSRPSDATKCLSALCVVDDRPVSTIRISFGYPTTFSDIDRLMKVFKIIFINGGPNPQPGPLPKNIRIKEMYVFPITGVTGFEVKTSLMDKWGLKYDRNWKLFSQDGIQVSTSQHPGLASLSPVIKDGKMTLTYKGKTSITFDVEDFEENPDAPEGVKAKGRVHSHEVSKWLFENLGWYLYLVKTHDELRGRMSFSACSEGTLAFMGPEFNIHRVHTNLVLEGIPAFSEEGQPETKIGINGVPIWVWKLRPLCMTSSVVPNSEEIRPGNMKNLAQARARYGMTPFGSLFGIDPEKDMQVSVGDVIAPL